MGQFKEFKMEKSKEKPIQKVTKNSSFRFIYLFYHWKKYFKLWDPTNIKAIWNRAEYKIIDKDYWISSCIFVVIISESGSIFKWFLDK